MAKFKLEDGTEVEAFTKEEVEQQVSGLKKKVDELLSETKEEKKKRQELEAEQAKIEEDRQKEKGEFKSLYEKSQADLEKEREEARKFRVAVQQKELEGESFKIAAKLTKDTARAELLKKEALQFAKYTDEGVKFEIGGVSVANEKVIEHLTENYPFLVDGSGANGGGASGGKGGGAASGDMGGDKASRLAAIKAKYPDL